MCFALGSVYKDLKQLSKNNPGFVKQTMTHCYTDLPILNHSIIQIQAEKQVKLSTKGRLVPKKDVALTFSLTFSKEEGETTEKQTKKTSVCGQLSGRNLS